MSYDVHVSFVKDRNWEPLPVFWTDNPLTQFFARLFVPFFRKNHANLTELGVNIPSEITPANFLQDLCERGVLTQNEARNSSIFIELDQRVPLMEQKFRNGTRIIIQVRAFAVATL